MILSFHMPTGLIERYFSGNACSIPSSSMALTRVKYHAKGSAIRVITNERVLVCATAVSPPTTLKRSTVPEMINTVVVREIPRLAEKMSPTALK